MSLWQLAARNVWQNRGRYISYLASAIFSVMIYFLYTALVRHPELQSGYRGAAYVVPGMRAAAVVIAGFTLLFLLYANSAFVQSRLKEFGLLSLMGITKFQLVQIMLFEGLIVAGVALTAGIGLALLFLRLFLLAISTLLQLPEAIPFYAGAPVWTETILLFGSFFLLVSLLSMQGVLRRRVIQLIRAARQPKGAPSFSRWKTVLGLLLLLGGYAWASIPNMVVIVLGIIPVTAMVSLGTFLLLREGSIAFLTWLHKRERYFYRPGPFLSVSQLVFKMQENYRVLSAAAILMAVILTAVGTSASLYAVASLDTRQAHPHALQVSTHMGATSSAELVEQTLAKHGASGLVRTELATVMGRLQMGDQGYDLHLLPYSFYERVARPEGELVKLAAGQDAVLVSSTGRAPAQRRAMPLLAGAELVVGEQQWSLTVVQDASGRVLNDDGIVGYTLVLPDERFLAIVDQIPAGGRSILTVWDGERWKEPAVQQAVLELAELYDTPVKTAAFSSAVIPYLATIATLGMALFIGLFVSLVFFASACSLLYFRLFTEIEDDRKYFRRLAELGVGEPDLKRLALKQAMVIFFVPFLTGLVHSTFAMKALGTLALRTVLQYGWMVAAGYLVLYALYFAVSYNFYWRSLRAGLRGQMV